MKVKYSTTCDYVLNDNQNKISIIGIFNTIGAKMFPTRHSRMFLVTLFESDKSESEEITISLLDENSKEIIEPIKMNISVNKKFSDMSAEHNHIFQLTDTVFESPGLYKFRISGKNINHETPLKIININ